MLLGRVSRIRIQGGSKPNRVIIQMTSGDQKTGAGAALVAEETGVTKPQTLQKCISCVRSVRLLIRGMFCCVLDIQ